MFIFVYKDIIYQIITDDDSRLEEKLTLASENSNGIPCVIFLIGEKKDEIINNAYINVEENELLDTFLDLFSVYTFPQEYGADFEELRPLFEHNGKISTEKGEGFNLCVFRKPSRTYTLDNEIKRLEQENGSFVLASRITNKNTMKLYSI